MHLNIKPLIFLTFFLAVSFQSNGQKENPVVVIPKNSSNEEIIDIAARVTPSARQLSWQHMELTTFVHFSPNTFYDQEWGSGKENPKEFNPSELDAEQWVRVCKEAGSKCVIITAKHHDGFCLWPSKYTSNSVAASPWKNGKGDILKEVSDACHKAGIGFGVYLSPWDRHEQSYGSDQYNIYFMNQLRELLTNYGEVAEVWFDGACGEGPNGKKQIYDWAAYYDLIRKLQPGAVIAVMGPDVRWVGTESGYGRETEWSVVPAEMMNQESIAANSQQTIAAEGFIPSGDMTAMDLGSREIISKASKLAWYPSEVDVSIRPGWFWHESENDRVKSPEKLLDIYYSSIGRNSVLLLNIPPDRRGLIHENDIASLRKWKSMLDGTFHKNLAQDAMVRYGSRLVTMNNPMFDGITSTHLELDQESEIPVVIDLPDSRTFDVLMLQENIQVGQRIERFRLEAFLGKEWKTVCSGTTVGYKRILRFNPIKTNQLRLIIEQSRLQPALAEFGLYLQPPFVSARPGSATFTDTLTVTLTSSHPGSTIYYTTDGSEPGEHASKYLEPLCISQQTQLNYIAFNPEGIQGLVGSSGYFKSRYAVQLAHAADPQYSGSGPMGLVDGAKGSMDFADGKWTGLNGTNLDATIDLGHIKTTGTISVSFLENTNSWIFLPSTVRILVSEDGTDYREVRLFSQEAPDKNLTSRKEFTCKSEMAFRFVRVVAEPLVTIPAWHPGAGSKAWVFADEISIE